MFPASTARAASQVFCHRKSEVGNFGYGPCAELAVLVSDLCSKTPTAAAVRVVSFRKSRRATMLLMRNSVSVREERRPVIPVRIDLHRELQRARATGSDRSGRGRRDGTHGGANDRATNRGDKRVRIPEEAHGMVSRARTRAALAGCKGSIRDLGFGDHAAADAGRRGH